MTDPMDCPESFIHETRSALMQSGAIVRDRRMPTGSWRCPVGKGDLVGAESCL